MTNTTTDLEQLEKLASLHAGDDTHACCTCGEASTLLPAVQPREGRCP